MKKILRNGEVVEVNDNYKLEGEEQWYTETTGTDAWTPMESSLGADEMPEGNERTTINGGETSVPLNVPFRVIGAQRTYPLVNGERQLVYMLELGFKDGSRIILASTTFTRSLRNIVAANGTVDTKTVISPRTLKPAGENGLLIGQVFTGANSGADVVAKCEGKTFVAVAEERKTCRFNIGKENESDSSRYCVCAVERK